MKRKSLGFLVGLFAVMAFVVGVTANVWAGKIYQTNGTAAFAPFTVAKEFVEAGTASSPKEADASTWLNTKFGYTPTDIPLGSLSDPTISLKLSAGKWDVKGGTKLYLVDSNNNIIGECDAPTGGLTAQELVFSKTSTQLKNGETYHLAKDNGGGSATTLAAGDVQIVIPPGTSSITLTVNAGSSATQNVVDTASCTFVQVKPQFSAEVTTKLDALIDPSKDFKEFTTSTTPKKDTLTVTIKKATLDYGIGAVTTKTGTVTITIKPSDLSGIDGNSISDTLSSTCSLDKDKGVITCSKGSVNLTAANKADTITIPVTGEDVLAERTFTVTAEVDFDDTNLKDRTLKNDWPLLQDADAGQWKYSGATAWVPLLMTGGGYSTFINLFSTDTSSSGKTNTVRAVVQTEDGSLVTVTFDKKIVPGQKYLLTAADIANAVESQTGKKVYEANGVKQFTAKINVICKPNSVSGYAVMVDPVTGNESRIPLFDTTGGGNGLD